MEHLEALVASDSAEDRESHRIIARWIKNFITTCKDDLSDTDYANRNPEPPVETEYMEFDSEGKSPSGNSLDNDVPVGHS